MTAPPGPPPPGTPVEARLDGWQLAVSERRWLWWVRRRCTAQIGPTHLVLRHHRQYGSLRLPWARVDTPVQVADSRDAWTQAFEASLVTEVDGTQVMSDRPRPAIRLRWTTDGRAAAHAHELTEWRGLYLGRGWNEEALAWLATAIAHAQATADELRRDQAFDAAVSGHRDAKAHEALRDLLDEQEG